ncbi:hypothetical protein SEA_BOYNAMEDSUE_74 [Gordonia phage BoyNamedSue]|uniref:Uncharacterized protein n=1 Tax=Gordonia phage BoyNamedSue TaxID=2836009 RepID=A0A8F3E1P1_9CAUD|nr:hypothetical protein PP491_gp74 [Gordonia phage BoyNamedSue]QWY79535.1 hypothetical protein SEA_BOYNAMEDSUE_74 [Gordonia phage BoyNamedSue]QYW01100.1 hypothetical protein SEA_ALUME_74 [Gordonia phage AlumE]
MTMHETVRLNVDPNHEHVHWAPPARPRFAIGERVRYVREDGFAGKITGRCWMSDSIKAGLTLDMPDGLVVKVTHVPDGQERYLGWELAARPSDLEHLD